MGLRKRILAGLLVLLAGAGGAGLYLTRDPGPAEGEAAASSHKGARPFRQRTVDTRPLLTARKLAALAVLPEERNFAEQAVRLGNHSVDLAFTDALRSATENPPKATPELQALTEAREKAEAAVDEDQRLVQQLTRKLAAASGAQKDALADQVEVAKAQAELDQDELDDAASDLERAGGDPQARVKRLKEAHEAAEKDAQPPQAAEAVSRFAGGSLAGKIQVWAGLRNRLRLLAEARQEALDTAQRIDGWRTRFSERLKREAASREAEKQSAAGFAREGAQGSGLASRDVAKASVASLKRLLARQRIVTDMGRRIEDERELADVYGDWSQLVEDQARAAFHQILEGGMVLLALLLAALGGSLLAERLFRRAGTEEVQARTLATVTKFAIQAAAVLAALFVIIGIPSQTTTILGLAGAGLTVAMKDFIVAFFGWFILMGRNGIRVGDWVEIKGVGGEVAEITLLRTVLLETGSWNDAGHPTGRRVAFVNSFAIEGHFFNFSTSGQWMWDELKVLIPAGQDPYPVIDGIQRLVERETEASARLAEQEWQKAARAYRVKAFSAVPGLQVVPTSSGIEVHVRYITRAYERHEIRKGLYQAVLELMHGRRPEDGAEQPADA
jgi:small-conductance mechanosensitive channel